MKKKLSRRRKEQTIAIIAIAAVVLIATAAILIFVASKNDNLGSNEHDHEHDHDHASELTLKVAVDAYEGQIHYNSAVKFAEQVESRTGGEVQVEVYPKGKLGDNATLIGALETNSDVVDIVIAPVSDFTVVEAKMDMSTLPFMFADGDEAWNFLNGDLQKEIEANMLNRNIRVLTHYAGEATCIVSAKRVINNATDVNSMRFAIAENTNLGNAMQMMNASAIALDLNTAHQAIAQDKCDGYMGTLKDIYESHMYQQRTYLAVSYHTYEGLAFAISENAWRGLGEYQTAIQEIATSSAYTDRELVKQDENNMLDSIKASGIRVLYPNMFTFTEKVESYLRSFSSKYGTVMEKHLMNKRANR